jgi:hypothetical protein
MDAVTISIIIGALLAVSEALSLIPGVASNGVFQVRRNNHGTKGRFNGQNRDELGYINA